MSSARAIVQSLLALALLGCESSGFVLDFVDAAALGGPSGNGTAGDGGMAESASPVPVVDGSEAGRLNAVGQEAPSCAGGATGTTNCGESGESCCTSLEVAGGSFSRIYVNTGGGATGLANPASVSAFRLDKFDVTVGRFRSFASAWAAGYSPPAGSGKHTHLNDGLGLQNSASPGSYEPGWLPSDNGNVQPTDALLSCDPTHGTWTSAPGNNENLPVNCATWYEAYAFCIWDGGFLPSEAEWEYAAAGGSEQREFPWGSAPPGTASKYAIYGYYYPSGTATPMGVANIAPVGTAALGAGLWGQLDLVGELFQWTLDSYADYVEPCTDCASTSALLPTRVRRGGAFGYDTSLLNPAVRHYDSPSLRDNNFGIRCARTP